jgi:hypothetical protein
MPLAKEKVGVCLTAFIALSVRKGDEETDYAADK